MKINGYILILLAFALNCGAIDTDTEKFFNSGPDAGRSLPADRIYPYGRLFPFSFYSTGGGSVEKRGNLLPEEQLAADQREIISAGVTMIGPQYELNDRIISDAEKLKVKAIYTVEPLVDGQKVTRKYLEGKNVDFEKIEKSVTAIVKRVASSKEIAWWNLVPEELRYWEENEKRYLKTVSEAIRRADPMKRPVFMYEPNARNAKALIETAPYVDIIGKGMYTNYSGMKDSRIWCRWTIEQEIEAIRTAGRKNAVPVAIPEMFRQPAKGELEMIHTWVRHDIYSALAAGARGILVFSASRRPEFEARRKYLEAYLKVCRELNGKLKLGQAFLFGKRRSDLSMKIISGPRVVVLKKRKISKEYPAVSMANIAYHNQRYVFLVNSSDKDLELIVGGLVYGSTVKVQDIFCPEDEFVAPEGDFNVELKPLEVKAFRIYKQANN